MAGLYRRWVGWRGSTGVVAEIGAWAGFCSNDTVSERPAMVGLSVLALLTTASELDRGQAERDPARPCPIGGVPAMAGLSITGHPDKRILGDRFRYRCARGWIVLSMQNDESIYTNSRGAGPWNSIIHPHTARACRPQRNAGTGFPRMSTAEQKGARWRRKIGPLGVGGLSP